MPIKTKIFLQLTKEEIEQLQKHAQDGKLPSVRRKAQAVLMNSEGLHSSGIAIVVARGEYAVNGWIRAYAKERLASIFTGHTNNSNASKLTRAQKQHIKATLQQPPSDFGIPKAFWDIPTLKTYVKAVFGIIYSPHKTKHHKTLRLSTHNNFHAPLRIYGYDSSPVSCCEY